jgi:hypothetical protein
MIDFLYILFYVISGASVLVALLNKKIEEVLAIFFMLVIVVLYIAGLVGLLYPVMLAIKIYCSLAIFIALYLTKNSIKLFLKNIFSYGFFGYLIVIFVAFYFLKDTSNHFGDEFTHWAFYSKSMYFNNVLLYDVNFTNYSYPPSSNLIHYFGLKLINKFDIPTLYIMKSMFILSFAFIKFHNLSYINKFINILIIFALYFINIQYLLVDIDIAIIFSYGCLLIFTTNKTISYYDLIHIGLVIIILTLIKSSGIFFALSLAVLFLLNIKIIKLDCLFNKRYLYGLLLLPILVFISWKIYRSIILPQDIYYIEKAYSLSIFNSDIMRFVLFFKYFFYNSLFFYPIDRVFTAFNTYTISFLYSPGFHILLCSLCYYWFYVKYANMDLKKILYRNYFIFLFITLIYMLLNIILYLTTLYPEGGGGLYPSLSRYFTSLVYAYYYIALHILIIFNVINRPHIKLLIIILLLFMVYLNFKQLHNRKQMILYDKQTQFIPSFVYDLPKRSIVCLDRGNQESIFDGWGAILIRTYALSYVNLSFHNIKCDYYFININQPERYKFISSNVKMGDLYKVIDKDKNVYEYILTYKKERW